MAENPNTWGKDHWSTFAYVETRCVDYAGVLDPRHMRCNPHRHVAHARAQHNTDFGRVYKYPTQLKTGVLEGHDDWDCIDDLQTLGLLKVGGTGVNPVIRLTPWGEKVASELRAHKAAGGVFNDFVYREPLVEAAQALAAGQGPAS